MRIKRLAIGLAAILCLASVPVQAVPPLATYGQLPGFEKAAISPSGDHVAIVGLLGGVDKFEPVSCGGDMDHAEEAFGELVVAGGDGSVDFQVAEEALDVIAFLVERPVMFDLDATV